jgi:hypothetical protein
VTAIQRFKIALQESSLDISEQARIIEGYETLTDNASKERRAAFFLEVIERMDAQLDPETRHAIRDACACSKGGWRLKAMQGLAREHSGDTLEEKLAGLREITHMGKPVLNPDGTITAQIGDGNYADHPDLPR